MRVKRFDTVDEIINLGIIKDGNLISIVGKGEIAITRTWQLMKNNL